MKRLIIFFVAFFTAVSVYASDRTLRVNYEFFGGGKSDIQIALSSMSVTDHWYGRTVNMDKVPVEGNGKLEMTDDATGLVLYSTSFSTLFQEWLSSDESKIVTKAFENTFLIPMPVAKATVHIELYDFRRNKICEYSHPVNPDDILIAHKQPSGVERRYIYKGGEPEKCIDVAILAEGYTQAERELFYDDATRTVRSLFCYEPFLGMRDRFNFLAVFPESKDSGVSVPGDGIWKETAVGSNFDTFYIERYLTTEHIFKMHDILDGIPYEHLIVLANTDVYGGGGIYNSYTLTTAHHKKFPYVVVHEFGHSFGALGDEYSDDSYSDPMYFSDIEPWEANLTTMCDFGSKWQDMIDAKVPGVGLYEGAGYTARNVWRPVESCRMRDNVAEDFCPVCKRAIERMIRFYTEEEKSDKAYRPLDPKLLKKNIAASQKARIESGKISGSQVIVAQKGKVILNECFGKASAGGKNLKGNEIYRIASMTKPVTALALLIEQERGHLDIRDKVSDYLPEFGTMYVEGAGTPARNPVRIYQLVMHNSGIGDLKVDKETMKNMTLAGAIESLSRQKLEYEPGTKAEYSTGAFDVAAAIIEKVSGMEFEKYLKINIFDKLGMKNTTFSPSEAQWKRFVTMHERTAEGKSADRLMNENCIFENFPVSYPAAGAALASTADDYMKFAMMLLEGGTLPGRERVIGEETLRLMPLPCVSELPALRCWGLGVRYIFQDDYTLPEGSFGWSGAYGTHFWIDPLNETVVVYMRNSAYDGGAGAETANELERDVMASFGK